MTLLWQSIIAAVTGITLAVFAGFAGTPQRAVAPTENVPAVYTPSPVVQVASSTPQVASTTPVKEEKATTTPQKPVVKEKTATSTVAVHKKDPEPKVLPAIPPKTTIQTVVDTFTKPLTPTTTPPVTLSLNDQVHAAVVNVVCTTLTAGPLNSISGSGVLVDSRGIILTNAHVAQFFLLKDYPSPNFVNCIIRTGSPAYPRYTAELLFLPPSWMAKNAYKINQENPTGNGEHDYAFLRITGTINPNESLPVFPHLSMSVDPPTAAQRTLLAAYPAGFLGGITVAQALYSASAYATVGDLYTFGSNTLDLFSIGGTVLSQKGSSGGAATDEKGTLLGLIVTATDAPDTASRDLRAITTSYIIADFAKEFGSPLENFLLGDIVQEAHTFQLGTAPTLTAELINALKQK